MDENQRLYRRLQPLLWLPEAYPAQVAGLGRLLPGVVSAATKPAQPHPLFHGSRQRPAQQSAATPAAADLPACPADHPSPDDSPRQLSGKAGPHAAASAANVWAEDSPGDEE